ncbi:MAG TPA: DUF3592 domain-containing protein [Anaerolineales bacterium]
MPKKYSVNWENGEAVSFEVDGVLYESLDQIPNPADMKKLLAMVNAAEDQEFFDGPNTGEAKPSFPVEKIILMVFTGVAILMLLIAFFSSASAISTILKQRSAPGRVVDVVAKRQYINEQDRIIEEYYYPVVDFTAGDGHRRSVQMSVGSNTQEYEKGEAVTVLYDPAHPLDAQINDLGTSMLRWILPGITGILGIAFLGAVLVVRKFMPPEEPQPDKNVKVI